MSKKQRYPKAPQDSLFLKPLLLKNAAQEFYTTALKESTVTICVGPAGTGKTYLATYVALKMLLENEVDKIILTRPIVATEDIGYLPGDMQEKIHPYVLPLLDAVEMHLGPTKTKEMLEDRRIEVIPLAYMRGRSLNRAFLILDEAQNTTKEQMKMFLTRIGYDSRISINGDASQTDLPKHIEPGLGWAIERLRGCDPSIAIAEFSSRNCVRHPLIEKMIQHLDGPSNMAPRRRERSVQEVPRLLQSAAA